MIGIISDLGINFKPDVSTSLNPRFSVDRGAQERLFKNLEEYLSKNGATNYSIGSVGNDGDLSIIEDSGYWIIVHSEHGDTRLIAIFFSFMDAVKFFLFNRLGNHRLAKEFPWNNVF